MACHFPYVPFVSSPILIADLRRELQQYRSVRVDINFINDRQFNVIINRETLMVKYVSLGLHCWVMTITSSIARPTLYVQSNDVVSRILDVIKNEKADKMIKIPDEQKSTVIICVFILSGYFSALIMYLVSADKGFIIISIPFMLTIGIVFMLVMSLFMLMILFTVTDITFIPLDTEKMRSILHTRIAINTSPLPLPIRNEILAYF